MICVIYGTTGELIKLAPVLRRLEQHGHTYLSVTTAQQVTQISPLIEQLSLRQPDVWLAHGADGRDLDSNTDVPKWLARVGSAFVRNSRRLHKVLSSNPGRPLVLVHGDTMTTVLGAAAGRLLRASVAHVESGLRSFNWAHPFPEELNRRAASRLARIHYAPGRWAAANVRCGTIIDTGSNTIRDSLAMCPDLYDVPVTIPGEPFGIVSLHRFELINNRGLFGETLGVLAKHAQRVPLLFVDHPVTAAVIRRNRLDPLFDGDRFVRVPRLGFFPFVALMKQSAFLVTDSGGSQEESFYLDIPCLVHRKTTERREGLAENVVISRFDLDVVRGFLEAPGRFRRKTRLPAASPSEVIVSDLAARGFL